MPHISAVASAAGYQICRPEYDVDSIDGILISDTGKRSMIGFQVKATSVASHLKDDHIVFPLKIKNYDELRIETANPRILIVLYMPEQHPDKSLEFSDSRLCMKQCAYWINLAKEPPTQNKKNITVYVPRSQPLSVQQMQEMMAKVNRDGEL
ncbi:MAG: DUF4365 domain-containing protein [Gammaproteobacteria bacterium]|nr:DUF4365 domain-containing protein [Gammaproteobacteria bacterium]